MSDKFSRHLSRLLVALPIVSLVLGAVAWLRYGFDLPWFDDWRGYDEGNIGSLNPSYLFREINDTMAPVGFALDALAQRFLDGNSIAYQLVSMTVVLGSLLLLQWKLLYKVLGNRLQAAACFSLTVLMLQPGSYWGMENLAYHQCLPLVFILAALWLIVGSDRLPAWRLVAIPLLGLVAGFTYISGAFGVFAAGIGLLIVARYCHAGEARRRITLDASLFTGVGIIAVAVQTVSFYLKFHEYGTHAGIPMALPVESAFWMFFLGKIGRSLLLAPQEPEISFALAMVACGVTVGLLFVFLRRGAAANATQRDRQIAGMYTALAALVFVYMLMVAAGRANYRPAEMTRWLDVFVHGFSRFHFFWATLLWPWLAAGVLVLSARHPWAQGRPARWGGAALILAVAVVLAERGAYSHMEVQRELAALRLPSTQCLLKELQGGGELRCPGLLPSRFTDLVPDAYPAYRNARKMGASFVRYFPLLPDAKRSENIAAFYSMAGAGAISELNQLEKAGSTTYRALGKDPQMYLKTGQKQVMAACETADVDVVIKVGISDSAQIFYKPLGTTEYDETYSAWLAVKALGEWQTLTFRIKSPTGFEETLRIDPVTQPQSLEIQDIRIYCVRLR